jgi:hypothetical protein
VSATLVPCWTKSRTVLGLSLAIALTTLAACSESELEEQTAETAATEPTTSQADYVDEDSEAFDGGVGSVPHPCEFVEIEEVRRLSGVDFPVGVSVQSGDSMAICQWDYSLGDQDAAALRVQVTAPTDAGPAEAIARSRAVYDEWGESTVSLDLTPHSFGLEGGGLVMMDHGQYFIMVEYIPLGSSPDAATARAIAEHVLRRF